MKKGFAIVSIIALLVAVAGVIIAIAAYFKNKDFLSCCCDEEDDFMNFDDDLDYFSADMEDPEFEAEIIYDEPTIEEAVEEMNSAFEPATEPVKETKK